MSLPAQPFKEIEMRDETDVRLIVMAVMAAWVLVPACIYFMWTRIRRYIDRLR